jgi:hypothetical protein
MKTVKILSMQRVINHGSFLQGYGLKKTMEALGAEVSFLDIKPGENNEAISTTRNSEMKYNRKHHHIARRMVMRLKGRKQRRLFETQTRRYLGLPEEMQYDAGCDLAVIGSDEVFNCSLPSRWGFSAQLFGDIPEAGKVVTYAASCGRTTCEGLTPEFVQKIRSAMNRVAAISVRDGNTETFVRKTTGRESILHLDPVFIYDFSSELRPCDFRRPFLLLYSYANRMTDPGEIRAVKAYAKRRRLKIVCAGVFQYWCNHNVPASSFELLGYFQRADCVITDTFHGTVLSIKYHRRFVAIPRPSNRIKITFLLERLGLTDRACERLDALAERMDRPVDYDRVQTILSAEREKSIAYLKDALT